MNRMRRSVARSLTHCYVFIFIGNGLVGFGLRLALHPANGGPLVRKEVSKKWGPIRFEKVHTIHRSTRDRITRPLHKEQATMQKSSTATVNAASAASAMAGSDKDMKDVSIVGGLILFLALVVAAFWYYSQANEAAHSNRSSEAVDSAQVSRVFKTPTDNARFPLRYLPVP